MKLKYKNDVVYVHADGLHEIEVAFGTQIQSIEEFVDPVVIWTTQAQTVCSLIDLYFQMSEYEGNE